MTLLSAPLQLIADENVVLQTAHGGICALRGAKNICCPNSMQFVAAGSSANLCGELIKERCGHGWVEYEVPECSTKSRRSRTGSSAERWMFVTKMWRPLMSPKSLWTGPVRWKNMFSIRLMLFRIFVRMLVKSMQRDLSRTSIVEWRRLLTWSARWRLSRESVSAASGGRR